jgi:ABC-type transporter Mla maintaining outer membrane lipid asymmetry ATPase subunit MlaF
MEPASSNARDVFIEMRGLSVGAMRDASTRVAENVNWKVSRGEYWVIAGLQGSGKTDFLMMTAGLMAPRAGDYRLFGEPMPIFDEARLPVRLRLGLVFDGGQLFNHLTVRENVALPLRYHHNIGDAAAEPETTRILRLMELEPWADSTPGAIGRNWQKRVGLGRALMLKPQLLLVDNPLAGLDLRHLQWWLDFLDRLSSGIPEVDLPPLTIVATTSDLRRWQDRARQFAVLRNRQFVTLGTWEELHTTSDELLQELLMSEPRSTSAR